MSTCPASWKRSFCMPNCKRIWTNASPEYQAMNERALSLLYTVQEAAAFVLPELTAVEPERLRSWVQEDGLQDYAHMVDDIIRSRAHVLPEREEQILAMASPALETMDNAFTMLDSVDLKRGEVTDEEGHRVPLTDGCTAVCGTAATAGCVPKPLKPCTMPLPPWGIPLRAVCRKRALRCVPCTGKGLREQLGCCSIVG